MIKQSEHLASPFTAMRPLRLVRRAVMAVTLIGLCCTIGLPRGSTAAQTSTTTQPAIASTGGGTSSTSIVVPAYRQANNVAILTIKGMVDRVTLASLERRMKQAVKDGADAVVLDIDTLGGEVPSALDICNLLKNHSETPPNVIAWIHPTAFSAGTVIGLACREMVVAPSSTLGDAAVIAFDPLRGLQPLPATERSKIEAPWLAEIVDSARRNHYDEKLALAFAKLGDGLWMLENTQTGERVFVDLAEYRAVFGDDPPPMSGGLSLAVPAPIVTPGKKSSLRPLIDQSIPRVTDSAGLSAAEQQQLLDQQQSLPPVRQPLSKDDRGKWRLVRQVVDDKTLLTLKADEAIYYGIATAVIASDAEIASYFGTSAANVKRYDQSWSESLVRFLISWPVKLVLIIVFLVCLFVELAVPGFGIFGTAAVIALLILIGAPALAGMAQWWEILLIAIGLLLVATELFLIPGFGITGVAGALCLLVGLIGTFVSDDIRTAEGQSELWTGLLTTLTASFIGGVAIWFISKQIQTLPIFNRLILTAELPSVQGAGVAAGGGIGLLESMGAAQRSLQPGDEGIAETDLRPAGRASIGGRLVDVQSPGVFVHKGTPIRVTSVGRYVIEVEEFGA